MTAPLSAFDSSTFYEDLSNPRRNNAMSRKRQIGAQISNSVEPSAGTSDQTSAPPKKRARKSQADSRAEKSALSDKDAEQLRNKRSRSEEEDETRRSRGRPRLDTKDETKADKRKTQIRVAQRAYRGRKEETISTLTKEVQQLKASQEAMQAIFLGLYDFAVCRGVTDREPDFASILQNSNERVMRLADPSVKINEEIKNELPSPKLRETSISTVDTQSRDFFSPQPALVSSRQSPNTVSVWGYEVSRNETKINGDINRGAATFQPPQQQEDHLEAKAANRHVPFVFDTDPNLWSNNLGQWRVQAPKVEAWNQHLSLNETLPLPSSFAQTEVSFARRLNRYAAERGFTLLSLESIFPKRFAQVFAFTLKFQTREQIGARLKACIESSAKESTYAWRQPFTHLGGAGTYYPNHDESTMTMMPKFRTGMSMGPFSETVMSTREELGLDFHMNVAGFTGEHFDANDVESYLVNKGIDLSTNPDVVEIDLDQVPCLDDGADLTPGTGASPKTPGSLAVQQHSDLSQYANTYADGPMGNDGNSAAALNPFEQSFAWQTGEQLKQRSSFAITDPMYDNISLPLSGGISTPGLHSAASTPKRVVTMNIPILIAELVSEGNCLGRSAGFKPSLVDAAVRRAISITARM